MKENITNRPDLEQARQAKVIRQHAHRPEPQVLKPDADVDETPLPTRMREKIETIEVSTFKPKGVRSPRRHDKPVPMGYDSQP